MTDTYRAYSEGVSRLVGLHEPECIGLGNEEFANECDCRTIRMLVIGVLQERLVEAQARITDAWDEGHDHPCIANILEPCTNPYRAALGTAAGDNEVPE